MSGQFFVAPIGTPLGAAPGPEWKPLGLVVDGWSLFRWGGDDDDEPHTPIQPTELELSFKPLTFKADHRFQIMLGWRALNRTGKPLLHNGRKWRG